MGAVQYRTQNTQDGTTILIAVDEAGRNQQSIEAAYSCLAPRLYEGWVTTRCPYTGKFCPPVTPVDERGR